MSPHDQPNSQKSSSPRATTRDDESPEKALSVYLLLQTGDPVRLEWANISVSGTMVLVPTELATDLVEGAPVLLRFGIDDQKFRVNGRVVWRHGTEDPEVVSLGLHFAFLDPTIAESHPKLWEYFNRRKAFRVPPAPDEGVDVTIVGPEGDEQVRMMDISATGICITVPESKPPPAWIESSLGHKYELFLTLVPEHGRMRIVTRAERLFRRGIYQCWGMSILEEDERYIGDALEVIEEYVMARQRQMRGVEDTAPQPSKRSSTKRPPP